LQLQVTPEETDILIRWKESLDTGALGRMKAEAILHASE